MRRYLIHALRYVGLILCTAALAYCFSVEHTHVLSGAAGASKSRMMACFFGFIVTLILLAVVVAYDVSRFLGRHAELSFLQGGRPRPAPPEFAEAERLRAQGRALDAIGVLREYLQEHPDEVEVMSRIAEIYNHSLKNYLAAALEYEEMLKHKLPDEQWAWAALHLAKCYGRLNEPEKSLALLERIHSEYGHTVAARRARKALESLGTENTDEPSLS